MKFRKNLNILAAFIPLVIGIYFLNKLHEQIGEKAIEHLVMQEEIYSKQATRGIESFFSNCKFALNYLSTTDQVINSNREMPAILSSFYKSYKNIISGISRIDSSGNLIYTYPYSEKAIGKNVLNQKHNQEIRSLQKPVISDIFKSVQGFKTLVYAYPVFKDGKYNGAISFLIPFNYIAKKFLENIKIGNGENIFVLSSGGVELYNSQADNNMASAFNGSSNDSSIIKLKSKMLKGDYGYYRYVNNSEEGNGLNIKHMVYYPVKLENTFWTIGIIATEAELLNINQEFQNNFILILAISFATFFGFIIFYYKSKSRTESKLKFGEERYKLVAQQTGQIIYERNIDKNEIEWAGAVEGVVGYSESEFKNFDYNKFIENIHEDDRVKVKEESKDSINDERDFSAEFRFKHKSGEYIYLEDNGSLVKGRTERLRVGTIKDITERKIAEIKLKGDKDKLEKLAEEKTIELRKANELLKEDLKIREETEEELKIAKIKAENSDKLKSEFLAQMSHEIRTPINTILSFISLIKEELNDSLDGDLSMSFDGIGNAGKRIIRTIDLMLNMSELQTGSYDYRAEKIEIYGNVLEPLIYEYNSVAKGKGLEFQLIKEEKEVPIIADEYTVKQIFANLIDNAIKYSLEGEVCVIGKKTDDDKYCIEVKDSGIGISEEYIPQLFDLFTQEDQGYTRSYEGNGLGLALVKKYCEMNKAEITVESTKGVGTNFRVIFNQ